LIWGASHGDFGQLGKNTGAAISVDRVPPLERAFSAHFHRARRCRTNHGSIGDLEYRSGQSV